MLQLFLYAHGWLPWAPDIADVDFFEALPLHACDSFAFQTWMRVTPGGCRSLCKAAVDENKSISEHAGLQ